jgi:geranylgeranyl diphosphate synthase type II
MQRLYERYKNLVESRLGEYFLQDVPQKKLLEAMRYSLLAGGKRIRPVLTLAFCAASGGRAEDALEFACALEMLHTYSLIHDDLPCMDDDDLRRGRPTNHIVFGEYTAVIAGDALQSAAFETILKAPLSAEKRAAAALTLAEAAGAYGMCAGQQLDMEGESRRLSADETEQLNRLKTAALIKAAAGMGCIAAGGTKAQLIAAGEYAEALGLAFQLRDDLLDMESTSEVLGKSIGSDKESGKSTFVLLLGADRCRELILENTEKAKAALKPEFPDTAFLEWLAELLAGRDN